MNCTIEADPDIAGIGVRAAVYAQAVFCIIPSVLLALFGPEPDRNYVGVAKETYIQGRATVAAMLVTNVALIIVSLIQAAKNNLTGYHAIIILNLSWIVFLSALLSSISLAYSHPLRNQPGFIAWLRLALVPVIQRNPEKLVAEMHRNQNAMWSLFQTPARNWFSVFHAEQHFVFLSIHIIGIGVLGAFLFGNFDGFGRRIECQTDIVMWTFTFLRPISGAAAIQHVWFAIYVVSLVPVVNVVICAIAMIIPAVILWLALAILGYMTPRLDSGHLPRAVMRLAIVLPFLVMIVFLAVSTEKTISANVSSNTVGRGESTWGFGQILAIVLMFVPAIETGNRVFAIWRVGLVAFPKLPARDAEQDRYFFAHQQWAYWVATQGRTRWERQWVNNPAVVTNRTGFTLGPGGGPVPVLTFNVPAIRSTATIEAATPEQVLTVLVSTGMRKQWDVALAFDGVLKRYDANTTQRYAVMNPEPLSGSATIRPRDFVLVQQVVRKTNGRIVVIHASMNPHVPPGTMGTLREQPNHFRATLPFEIWTVRPINGRTDVEIVCFALPQLEIKIPQATARNMGQRSLVYPYRVRWTFQNYGFAPIWGMPNAGPAGPAGPAPLAVGVLEREHMEPERGKYKATFRATAPGAVTVYYDIQERDRYYRGARASCKVIQGDEQDLTIVDDPRAGRYTLTFGAAGMIVKVTVFRTKTDNM